MGNMMDWKLDWRPHPGPQTDFLDSSAFEVLYGGAAGGGKSDALLIEGLRDPATGKFGPGVYPLAQRLNAAKWIGAALFYALWAGGAIHAAIHFQPEEQLPDRVVAPQDKIDGNPRSP